jgi:hypothetical protein
MFGHLTNDDIYHRLRQFPQFGNDRITALDESSIIVCRETLSDSPVELIDWKEPSQGFWSSETTSLEQMGAVMARHHLWGIRSKLIVVVPADEAYADPEGAARRHAKAIIETLKPHISNAFNARSWIDDWLFNQYSPEQQERMLLGAEQFMKLCRAALEFPDRTRIVVAHPRTWVDTDQYADDRFAKRAVEF